MSRYAKISLDGLVENIIIADEDSISLMDGEFILVDANTNEPQYGYEYNRVLNKFNTEKPYPSWILQDDLTWESPSGPKPTEGFYRWNEESLSWDPLS